MTESTNSPATDKPWQFQPGQSGNPNGRPKDQFSFMGILRSALATKTDAGDTIGELLVKRYIELALEGNTTALEALVARIDGKPAQSLTLRGDSAKPLHVRHSARLEVGQERLAKDHPAAQHEHELDNPACPACDAAAIPALPAPEQDAAGGGFKPIPGTYTYPQDDDAEHQQPDTTAPGQAQDAAEGEAVGDEEEG